MLKKQFFLSIGISLGPYKKFIDEIIELAVKKQSSYVCVANVHMTIEAHGDKAFAAVVNDADITTPDGMPLAKGLKILNGLEQDRVAGMDLLPDLLAEAEKIALPVYFYGGTQQMLDTTEAFCQQNYPALTIAGLLSPPFRALTVEEKEEIIQTINQSGAGIVFVALGCPKQEKWMAEMKGKVHACMVGIGGALPVMVGMQKRAPVWMQKASLEWLYRLLQEPKRLFKRYAITNSKFIFLLTKAKLLGVKS